MNLAQRDLIQRCVFEFVQIASKVRVIRSGSFRRVEDIRQVFSNGIRSVIPCEISVDEFF